VNSRRLLAGAVAAALLLSVRPADASILSVLEDILEFFETYIVPLDGSLVPMPPTLDGRVLSGTQEPIGEAPDSYITREGLGRFDRLFPDGGNPEWLPPTVVGTYATMREQDRKLRVNEAMDEAAKVVGDDEAATARLDDYELRNAVPDESIAGDIKLGTTVGIETAGQLHELTQLAAEANQLEADQRLQEDWERQQHNLYLHTSLRNGYWIGYKSWDVDQLATAR
jgi:hypothetical protein